MPMMILLTQIDHNLQMFQDAFNGGTSLPVIGHPLFWMWTLSAIGLLLAGSTALLSIRRDRGEFGPTNRRVCVALGVNGRERRLLRRVARGAGFSTVAGLLMSEGSFDHAVRHYTRFHGTTYALNDIRRKVYDDS